MLDFKAKMHQIKFRLGLRPRPRWGSSISDICMAGLKGPTSKGRGGERMGEWEGKEGEGREVEGRDGEGRSGLGHQVTVEPGPLRALLRHCYVTQMHYNISETE